MPHKRIPLFCWVSASPAPDLSRIESSLGARSSRRPRFRSEDVKESSKKSREPGSITAYRESTCSHALFLFYPFFEVDFFTSSQRAVLPDDEAASGGTPPRHRFARVTITADPIALVRIIANPGCLS